MGALNRGEHVEITTLERAIDSELSGNLIDVCPVGALTSRPYAFTARPWELGKTNGIDVSDAVGSNIRIDSRGRAVMRVQPRLHEEINEEWLHDKARYACDGLARQRLDRPYLRKQGRLEPVDWPEAFAAIKDRLTGLAPERMAALAGDQACAESLYGLKTLFARLGSPNLDCRQDGAKLEKGCRAGYLFNSTIAGIEEADAALLVATNPRWEAPLLNARLRKRFLRGGFRAALIGQPAELSYDCDYLGAGPETLAEVAAGKHPFAEALKGAERPLLVLGMAALRRPDGARVLGLARRLAVDLGLLREGWNGFNVLQLAAARVAGLDMGFLPGAGGRDRDAILAGAGKGEIDLLYLLGADEIDMKLLGAPGEGPFVIYQGHHGDAGAHRADVILPGAAFSEKNGLYVNTEGRVQQSLRAVFPPGEAKEDWAILRALSEVLGETLPYDDQGALRRALIAEHPSFAALDRVEPAEWGDFGEEGALDAAAFEPAIDNYYMTDPISRASPTMAACTEAFVLGAGEGATGTDG
jgi:NADH-quinone oxidoreductase subunit G